MRLPDFIIGGAPRSGTTWLALVADKHPAIEMAKPAVPEPKFFLRDDLFARGLQYYSETWFSRIAIEKCAGEKSTNYLESALAAKRIKNSLADVRLIFVLRNPVDRAFSNFLWSRQNGLETGDFETALKQEEERERDVPEQLRYARPHALYSRGLYADLLCAYFTLFSRDRILVLRYEDIASTPGRVASALHRFLDVPERPIDGEGESPINASDEAGTATMSLTTRRWLEARYAQPNQALYALLGDGFTRWPESAGT